MELIGMLVYALLLFIIGGCCLLFPRRIQGIARRAMERKKPSKIEIVNSYRRAMLRYINSDWNILGYRLISLVCFLMSFLMIYTAIIRFRK